MKLRNELVEKINVFNKIFELDFLNSNENEKNWKYYLDKISKHLFNQSYISFINENSLDANANPGSFEKYYNLFQKILKDYKSIISLTIPNQLYCASEEIIELFNNFLFVNNFKVTFESNPVDHSNLNYQIYPII